MANAEAAKAQITQGALKYVLNLLLEASLTRSQRHLQRT